MIIKTIILSCMALMSFASGSPDLDKAVREARLRLASTGSKPEAQEVQPLTARPGTSPEPGHPLYPDSTFYGNNSIAANILTLHLGIVPKEHRKAVMDNVIHSIIIKGGGHLPDGEQNIPHLLRTLSAHGYGDVAFMLATGPDSAALHPEDILDWCLNDLGGISSAPGTDGYRHLLMKPNFSIQELDSVSCSQSTPHGPVTSTWRKDLEKLHWEISLPEGITAEATLPDGSVRKISAGTTVLETSLLSGSITEASFVYDGHAYPETHASSIVELRDGTLLATYFGGTKERNPDVCIYTHRKEPGKAWEKEVLAADGIFGQDPETGVLRKACWNPVLFEMPDGEVWLFFKIGLNVKDWSGWLCRSRDGGRTWSGREPLPDGFLGPIKNKPELVNGRLICPSSTEDDGWRLHFEIYDLSTKTWTKALPGNSPDILAIQPAILRHGGGMLQAVARTRPTEAQREGRDLTRGKAATCWSRDGGLTWGGTSLLDVPNNQSGLDAVTLREPADVMSSGGEIIKGVRHVLIYNNFGTLPGTRKGPRTPLSIAVSTDGINWHHALTLEDSPIGEYSYPSIIQGRDGALHCVYTWRRRRIVYKKISF